MNRIDVRTEVRKLAQSKPVYAAAGAGLLASQALRQLPAQLAKLRSEAAATTLPSRAAGYVLTARARAVSEYERLASRGRKALNGSASTSTGKSSANGKSTRSTKSK